MPTFLNVLCRSPQSLALDELQAFVREGCFFELHPSIDPVPKDTQSSPAEWTSLEIHYQEAKRPVTLSRVFQRKHIELQREEALEELHQHSPPDQHPALLRALQEFQQVFVLEVDSVGATAECWAMVDAVASWLATARDGILFVSGEGFYDAALSPLYQFSG